MPSGLRHDTDAWLKDYEAVKQLADEVQALVQDRNQRFPSGGPEASRLTAQARRKLGSLGAALDNLAAALQSPACADVTENEKNRRRDLVTAVRNRREQLLQSLKRDQHSSNRADLLAGPAAGQAPGGAARETNHTAELDNGGLLSLQQQVMRDQDRELEELEKTVTSTRHIALAVNEELGLQTRLLDTLEEDVDVSHSRMRAAQKRLRYLLSNSSNWRSMCLVAALVVALVLVVLLAFKLIL